MNAGNLPLIGVSAETQELRDRLRDGAYGLFEPGGGCLAWRTVEPERTVMLYDPLRVVAEFFLGGGSTQYISDTEHVPRVVVDSAFSKAHMKRAHPSPYFSGRYALEWHGRTEPMEVPFPTYIDTMCVLAIVGADGSVQLRPDGSVVPQLERASNISDIVFIKSVLEPSNDIGLVEFLSGVVERKNLTTLVDRMSRAYALRMERGEEVPYKPLHLFGS